MCDCHDESVTCKSSNLPRIARQQVGEFGEFLALIGDIACLDRIGHAMIDVILENLFFDFLERRLDRLQLVEHVDTIAVFFQHARNAAHLPLDAGETRGQCGVRFGHGHSGGGRI
jgi:hypothetical protein